MNIYLIAIVVILGLVVLAAVEMSVYHRIVRRKVLKNFAQLSNGNYEHVISQMAPSFDHYFAGTHSLGGTRKRPETMRRWFERLY